MSIDGYIPPHIECPTGYVWDTELNTCVIIVDSTNPGDCFCSTVPDDFSQCGRSCSAIQNNCNYPYSPSCEIYNCGEGDEGAEMQPGCRCTCVLNRELGSCTWSLHQGNNLISFPFINYPGLEQCWNGNGYEISCFVDFLDGFSESPCNIQGIIGEGLVAAYMENLGGWVGSLTTINPYSGYWFKVGNSCTFPTFFGEIINSQLNNHNVHYGFNLLSYHQSMTSVEQGLVPISVTPDDILDFESYSNGNVNIWPLHGIVSCLL